MSATTSLQQSPVRAALPFVSRLHSPATFLGSLILALICLIAPPRAGAQPPTPLSQTLTTLTITDVHGHRIVQSTPSAPITLTANVILANGTGVALGNVVFCDGAVAQCLDGHSLGLKSIVLNPGFPATLTIVPTFGQHTYRAVYMGDPSFSPPADPSTSAPYGFQVVGPPPPGLTSTTLASSGNPGNYTLKATIAGYGAGKTKPTGMVSFLDSTNNQFLLGTAPVGPTSFAFAFQPPLTLPPLPPFIYLLAATADVNNDGLPDLLFVIPDYSTPNQYDLEVMLNMGNGQFGPQTQACTLPGPGVPTDMVVGDFNNDDKPDLAISTDDGHIYVLEGSGFGPFGILSIVNTQLITSSLTVGYLNNTMYPSIFYTTPLGFGAVVETSSFLSPVLITNFNGVWPSAIAVGDFNGDGFTDVVTAYPGSNNIVVWFGASTPQFGQGPSFNVGANPSAIAVADFTGNGILDLAVANADDDTVTILLGDGHGNFSQKALYSTGTNPFSLALGDFNGDGVTDIVVGNALGSSTTVLLGNGDGTFKKSTLTGDSSVAALAADFNVDGYSDIAAISFTTPDIYLSQWTATTTATLTGVDVAGTGTHNVVANYPGDTNYQGSTSGPVPLTAAPLATALKLVPQPLSIKWGQQVALNATLSPYTAQGLTTNGENVTFYDGATSLGPAPLALGVATLNVNTLSVGVHSLKAVYVGDTNFLKSTSSVVSFTVNRAASTTTLAAATGSPKVGVADLLTATVTGFSAPRGNVVFTQNGNTICTAALASTGKATCSYVPWTTTTQHLVATYQGDTDYAPSTSSTLNLTATYAFNYKVAMTFDSTNLTYPGATNTRTCVTRSTSATPTGTIDILDGNTLLNQQSVGGDGCVYWYINPGLNAGTHFVRAYYSGDSNNPGGYSDITWVIVSPEPTYMSASCWNSSFAYGQNYTCSVSVWSNGPNPPGTVNYSLDGGATHSATLTSGNTQFVIVKPAVGNHSVTIGYPGTANYAPASAATQNFTVTP